MKEILFAWLGDEDLDAVKQGDWPGPIGQAVRERRFKRLILLSARPTKVAKRYISWLEGRTNATITLRRERVDPYDLSQIFDASLAAVEETVALYPEAVLTFHLTAGTSITGAIWIILSKFHFDARLITSSIDLGVETVEAPEALTGSQLPKLVEEREARIAQVVAEPRTSPLLEQYEASDAVLVDALEMARRTAPHDIPVMIRGESGTGRARMAKAMHAESPRADGPFERVDPRGLTTDELLLEIYGQTEIEEIQARKRGKLELAAGGSLVLERIELFPMRVQVRLLRTMEAREFRRLDAKRDRSLDCRFFATLEGSPNELVQAGTLHEALALRLSVALITIPPLRARKSDLRRVVAMLWDDAQTSFRGTHKVLSANAMKLIIEHEWPGNVRELRSVLMRSILWSTGGMVTAEDVRRALDLPQAHPGAQTEAAIGEEFDIQEHLDTIARSYVKRALERTDGNKTQAANLLGLSSYQTLSNWMKRLDVTP